MGTIYQNNLVRDKTPDAIRKAGKQPIVGFLSQDEMTIALHKKLQEEVQEYSESGSIEEIADGKPLSTNPSFQADTKSHAGACAERGLIHEESFP